MNGDGSEYILDDDECPLAILMSQQNKRGMLLIYNSFSSFCCNKLLQNFRIFFFMNFMRS